MDEPTPRFWEIFFEVYEHLPRQGPGNRASAEKALALCRDLGESPRILDIGCGSGAGTIYLAELTSGSITAIDNHEPSIKLLKKTAEARGLTGRVRPVVADMADPELEHESFDLIWSEGALYSIGLEKSLRVCRKLSAPCGYLVFTDAVWLKDDPPREVKAGFGQEYPSMGKIPDVSALIEKCGFSTIDHFTLPDEAWWDDFYTPMERRIQELINKYANDDEALKVLEELELEPEIHRRYSDYYAYEYFITQRK